MDNILLKEIEEANFDSDRIRAIVKYLHIVTAELAQCKAEINVLKTTGDMAHVNTMIGLHSSTLESVSGHLSAHDSYLDAHDKHLKTLGDHFSLHDQQLQALANELKADK